MVTKPYIPRVPIAPPPVPLPDDYVCPDPEPRDMIQSPTINKAGYVVARHFHERPDTLVRAPCVLNFDPYDMNNRVEPDLLVAFGVKPASILPRNGYIIWEAGKPPDFVMEVASESTHPRDTGFKRELYARLGIAEYWRVDPTGGDFYGYALAGDRFVDGEYRAIDLTTEADGMIWGYSSTLDLCPCWHPAWDWDVDDESHLRFYDRKTGRYLCDFTLVEERLAQEIQARQDAEERIRQLEERLRRG
ncbi:MAG: Uma2 family endonuclease [Dehalococcoidia bacterium]|nr:Uma2 family endonuclease [Dehalococcoidia bacterium]